MSDGFYRLAPFIQDYIYRCKWTEMRDIQTAACDVIFDTDDNLLLASGTASGKTEAAFLPVLTKLYEEPSRTVGVLYLSPLKALINDQFFRLEDLLSEAHIPVTKWHGDVSQSIKQKLVRNPQGVLQTTPESLEAMLMRNKNAAMKLFSDLRFVIIDEVHYFMNNDRGIQLLCLLERLQRLVGIVPRRIGLSATLGDFSIAEGWLSSGTNRRCVTPKIKAKPHPVRLAMQYFPVKLDFPEDDSAALMEAFHGYLYESTLGKRCILFSNSKGQVEECIANLRRIAKRNRTPDCYYVHHANISPTLRELCEMRMKTTTEPITTGATVTLELGIDLGSLERIVQTGCPLTVSSFVQRLGRTGRRGQPSEMWFAFRYDESQNALEFYKNINWDFVMCIAEIQLYTEEKWIEPIPQNSLPFSLLYHQTMAYLTAAGESSAAGLAQSILTLAPFSKVSQEDYRTLLLYMLDRKQIEKTERGGILIGTGGEYKVNNYEFFAVFETMETYSVRCASEEIGTVQEAFPIGTQFALAGHAWEVTDLDKKALEICVKKIDGISTNMWMDTGAEIVHTKVMKKMRDVLRGDGDYPYLGNTAKTRFERIRRMLQSSGALDETVVRLTEVNYAVFPWLGTKAMIAMSYALKQLGYENMIHTYMHIPVCLLVSTENSMSELCQAIFSLKTAEIDKYTFDVPDNISVAGKYNDYVPKELLVKQYIEDFIDVKDMQDNLEIWEDRN